jgi:hypothetical protein
MTPEHVLLTITGTGTAGTMAVTGAELTHSSNGSGSLAAAMARIAVLGLVGEPRTLSLGDAAGKCQNAPVDSPGRIKHKVGLRGFHGARADSSLDLVLDLDRAYSGSRCFFWGFMETTDNLCIGARGQLVGDWLHLRELRTSMRRTSVVIERATTAYAESRKLLERIDGAPRSD